MKILVVFLPAALPLVLAGIALAIRAVNYGSLLDEGDTNKEVQS